MGEENREEQLALIVLTRESRSRLVSSIKVIALIRLLGSGSTRCVAACSPASGTRTLFRPTLRAIR